jgi:hypothetical protein
MATFVDALQDFCAGLADLPGEDFGVRVNTLLAKLRDVTPDQADWAARSLLENIAREPQPRVSVLGVLGDLLCRGVNLWGYLPHYIAAISRTLATAAEVDKAVSPLLPEGKRFTDLQQSEGEAILKKLPEALQKNAHTWYMVSFYLGPSMAIFQQVKGARQLARALGMQVSWLANIRTGPEWLPELPKFFAAADEQLPDPAPVIAPLLAELRRLSTKPPASGDAVPNSMRPIFEATTFVTPEVLDHAAAELAGIAAEADPAWASEIAGICGAFCERGASPERGVDTLIAGLPHLLDPVVAFIEACRALPTDKGQSPVDVHAETVSKKMPEARRAIDAISGYCLGTIAQLARSPAARLRHGKRTDLLAKLNAVRWHTGNTDFLWKMLQVLDEEIVVLAPEHNLGWRIKIAGVGDNFQLHALIAGHLVGKVENGKYPGTVGTQDQPSQGPGIPISPRAVATQLNAPCTGREPGFSSNLQLWCWTGLQKDGTLPAMATSATEHWIWNEGIPADITAFAGTRVVLLGPTNLLRSWNGGRIFSFMEASFKIVETMPRETVTDWLRRLAAREGAA